MSDKTNLGLVRWANEWLGRPYWYGTVCYKCTESLLESKRRQYPAHYTSGRMERYRADIAAGKWAADCIGLAKGYMWWDEALGRTRYGTGGCPDKSADGMLETASVKGDIADMPDTPGLMVWKSGHVGIYVGDGWVVEARGFDYGIVRTRLSERGWRKWFRLPGCEYVDAPAAEPTGDLRVTATSLNVRSGPGKEHAVLEVVHGGDLLTRAAAQGWTPVLRGGGVAWVSNRYIEEV